jgi:hypothetical protein
MTPTPHRLWPALAAGADKHELLDAIVPLLEATGVHTSIL